MIGIGDFQGLRSKLLEIISLYEKILVLEIQKARRSGKILGLS